MKKLLAVLICFTATLPFLSAQYAVSGWVFETDSKEPLTYVSVVDSATRKGTFSNSHGFFALNLTAGIHTLRFAYSGFEPITLSIPVSKDTTLRISLDKRSFAVDTVQIQSENPHAASLTISRLHVPIEQIKNMPALGGEADVMKTLQLTPGVQFGLEGTTGLFIRGGSPDQNLILLDEIPVYNINHLFGYFSIFPTEALKSVTLTKGGFPARFGGRLSSVLELQTREGDLQSWKKYVSLSTLAGHVLVEGPLVKNKSSILFSARRSWLDVFLAPITRLTYRQQEVKGNATYHFYDLTGKWNYLPSDKDRISLSIYTGKDRGGFGLNYTNPDSASSRSGSFLEWGNLTGSLRYQRSVGNRGFFQASTGYTRYLHENVLYSEEKEAITQNVLRSSVSNFSSRLEEKLLNLQYEFSQNAQHRFVTGSQVSFRRFQPQLLSLQNQFGQQRQDTLISPEPENNQTYALFVEHQFSPSARFSLHTGLRGEWFQIDSFSRFYLQPRISASYAFSETSSLKAAYSMVNQYLHLLTSSGLGFQADLWTPATRRYQPPVSHQWTLAYFRNLTPEIIGSVEVYYKTMGRVLEYRDGTSLSDRYVAWEDKVASGKGEAYGAEFFLHKPSGRLNGWMSYTLSWNYRTFSEINDGEPFRARFDRRHNLALYASWLLKNPQKRISATWTYVSGARATMPETVYSTPRDIEGDLSGQTEDLLKLNSLYDFGSWALYGSTRNNIKMRDFHKLDLGYQSTKTNSKGNDRTWGAGIYNLYGRRNPYFLFYSKGQYYDPRTETTISRASIREYSVLLWIPYISVSWEF